MSRRIEVLIPDDLATELDAFGGPVSDLLTLGLRQTRIIAALAAYSEGGISFARAAEIAEIPKSDLIWHARAAGLEPRWSEATVEEELA